MSQTAPSSDATVSGVVKDATTGQPIADAIVQIGPVGPSGSPLIQQRQFTDARGRFVFTGLGVVMRSDYQLLAAKAGYFDGAFGASGESNWQTKSTIHLTAGQWYSTADIFLARPGSISGTVTDERGEPVIGVYVRLLAYFRIAGHDHVALGQVVLTDDRGMYRVGELRPGRYVAMVPSVQSSAPAATPFLTLLGASAQYLESYRRSDGTFSDRPMIDLDDRTRVFVGGYPVPPPAVNGHAMGYPIAVSGGVSVSQAPPVLLDAGIDRTGVDIRLDPAPVQRISGVVQGPPDAIAGLALRLLPEGLDESAFGSEAATTLVASDGSFTFANVPAGNYTIDAPVALNQYIVGPPGLSLMPAVPFPPGLEPRMILGGSIPGLEGIGVSQGTLRTSRNFWARTPVTVGAQDVANVVVTLRPVMTMRGRIVKSADPNFPAPAGTQAEVSLESATGNTWNGKPGTDGPSDRPGEFIIEGITPGLYVLHGQAFGWTVKSVLVGGRERVNTPIDAATEDLSGVVVTFTNAVQSLSGSVTKSNGDAADSAAVILFPAEPDQWTNYGANPIRIQTARSGTDGAFRFRTLPAGDYYAVAVAIDRINAWTEPNFFARAQSVATRVSIAWGELKTAALKLVEVR